MSDALRVWLAQELKQRKWSQRELARQAGVSQTFISQILSGDAPPSVNFCHKIAAALGEPAEKVLRLAGILPSPPASEDDTLQEITDLARSLPPEDRQEILEYIRFRYQRRKG